MKKRRWVVTYDKKQRPFAGNTVAIAVVREGAPEYTAVAVWYDRDDDRANCVDCGGPLAAMSASCRHVAAALRAIRAGRVVGLKAGR